MDDDLRCAGIAHAADPDNARDRHELLQSETFGHNEVIDRYGIQVAGLFAEAHHPHGVMAGLVPAIHAFLDGISAKKDVDA
jgi:hypothetical protein